MIKESKKKKSFKKTLKKIKQVQLMLFFLQRFSVHKVAVTKRNRLETELEKIEKLEKKKD